MGKYRGNENIALAPENHLTKKNLSNKLSLAAGSCKPEDHVGFLRCHIRNRCVAAVESSWNIPSGVADGAVGGG